MRHRLFTVGSGLFLVLSLAFVHAGDPGAPAVNSERIGKLVTQLGSESFHERDEARKELEAIGTPALAALRKATKTGDLETVRRAADLIRVIEEQALTSTLLTPKKIHLKLKDVPVLQAVEKLARLSGYTLRVDGDRTGLLEKTVTLDTGEVSFWEALDRLGAKAGIVEKLTIASVPGDPNQVDVFQSPYSARSGPAMKKAVRRPPVPPLRVMKLPKIEEKPRGSDEQKKDAPEPPKDTPPAPEKKASPEDMVDPPETPANPSAIAAATAVTAPQLIAGRVILTPGMPTHQQVSYAGAARVLLKRAKLPLGAKPQAAMGKYYDLVLEASAEPRLLGFTVVGVPTVARAVDEHNQVLSFVIDPVPAVPPRYAGVPEALLAELLMEGMALPPVPDVRGVTVRLQQGAKPAKRLKELVGSLTAQVLVPNSTLLVLDDVLRAKGRTVDVKGGGRLQIDTVEKIKADTGPGSPEGITYQVVYKLDNLPGGPNGQANLVVVRNGRAVYINNGPLGGDGTIELHDGKGRRLTLVQGPQYNQENSPEGQVIRTIGTVQFRREPGQGEPARLVLTGTHLPAIVVPFRFVDVPLP